ncbi:MAG: terminase, partial [Deltaproteobacteria bacterium]|nr:terminase [Deltaproteobacteria bacterium]
VLAANHAARGMLAKLSDDPKVKQQYYNDDLGRPYSPVVMETDKEQLLKLREMSLPPRTVPHGAVALTCGIDVQKRGFWYLVRAWMPSLASYVVDYGYVETWEAVENICFDTYYPVLGQNGEDVGERMAIWRTAIDSGGTETEGIYTRTEEVYMWVRQNGRGVVHACKGSSRAQSSPVRWVLRERMPHNGKPIPGGLRLHLIDTNAIKNTDIGRLLNEDSTQPLRFHTGADDMLVSHLTAERQVRKGSALVWECVSKQNHLLDCLMLSAACADASWTPSLPLYVLQLRRQERADYAPVQQRQRPQAKRHKQEKESRW